MSLDARETAVLDGAADARLGDGQTDPYTAADELLAGI